MSRLKNRMPSPALVVALVALFVAMSGSAVAATTLLVHTGNIANGAVTGKKIANGAISINKLARPVRAALAKSGEPRGTVSGPQGPAGASGGAGANGANGPAGPGGVNSPLVYTFSGASGPDSGDCNNNWATDTYDTTYVVNPQVDGTFVVTKYVKGTFVTIAGKSQPNPAVCPSAQQTGGVSGAFQGVESWTVGSGPTNFDPTASCGPCSGAASSEQQNHDFQTAFFPGTTYGGPANYDFVYHTDSNGSWIDSNTPDNDQGNITG